MNAEKPATGGPLVSPVHALMAGVVPEETVFPFPEVLPEERGRIGILESLRGSRAAARRAGGEHFSLKT
jgi:hypothetical protein